MSIIVKLSQFISFLGIQFENMNCRDLQLKNKPCIEVYTDSGFFTSEEIEIIQHTLKESPTLRWYVNGTLPQASLIIYEV